MSTDPNADFQDRYLQTWIEPDPDLRRANVDRVWDTEGRLVVSSLGITVEGTSDIAAHIARVHDDLIAGKRLRLAYDLVLVWSRAGRRQRAPGTWACPRLARAR